MLLKIFCLSAPALTAHFLWFIDNCLMFLFLLLTPALNVSCLLAPAPTAHFAWLMVNCLIPFALLLTQVLNTSRLLAAARSACSSLLCYLLPHTFCPALHSGAQHLSPAGSSTDCTLSRKRGVWGVCHGPLGGSKWRGESYVLLGWWVLEQLGGCSNVYESQRPIRHPQVLMRPKHPLK